MVYSVDQLKSVIGKGGGVAHTNLYKVTLPSLGSPNGNASREHNLLCKAVNIPGKNLVSAEKTIGAIQVQQVNGITYGDVSMTFMVLNDFGIKDYFDRWQALAFNEDTYEVRYKSEYEKTVIISALKKGFGLPVYQTSLGLPKLPSNLQNRLPKIGPFDLAQGEIDLDFITDDQITYEVILNRAFPKIVSGFEFNNELDGIAELTVELNYDDFKTRIPGISNKDEELGKVLAGSLISRVAQLF